MPKKGLGRYILPINLFLSLHLINGVLEWNGGRDHMSVFRVDKGIKFAYTFQIFLREVVEVANASIRRHSLSIPPYGCQFSPSRYVSAYQYFGYHLCEPNLIIMAS